MSASGSTDVKPFPVAWSQILTIFVSADTTRLSPPKPVWNLMSTIGQSYMWSFSSSGREERRSYKRTLPALVPTAMPVPASSKRSADIWLPFPASS